MPTRTLTTYDDHQGPLLPQVVRDAVRAFQYRLGLHRPPLTLEYALGLEPRWRAELEDIPDLYKGTDTAGAVASFDGIPMAAHADLRPGTWRLVYEPPGGDDG